MQLEKVQYTTKASAAVGFGLLSRFLVVLFAATMPLAPPAAVLAQQPAQTAGQNQGATAITKTQTETAMTQPRMTPKLIYFNKVDKGGHFAAWEQPGLFAAELRAAFRSLR
jgi:pimeloyl-ACP methyl ester carboxylesterase